MGRSPSPNLAVSERNKLEKRIHEKFKLVKQSIGSDHVDEEQIKQQMLQQKGVNIPSIELKAQHVDLQRRRDELIEPHIQSARNHLTVRLQELDMQKREELQDAQNTFKQQMTELKTKLSATKNEIENRYEGERSDLQKGLEEVRQEQMEAHAGDMNKKLDVLKRQEVEVAEVEREVEHEARTRLSFIRRQAGRISQIIDDAENRALEELMFVESRQEAKKILDSVPTVAGILDLLDQGVEGLQTLIEMMNPEAAEAMKKTPLLVGPSEEAPAEVVEAEEEDPYSDREIDATVTVMAASDDNDDCD